MNYTIDLERYDKTIEKHVKSTEEINARTFGNDTLSATFYDANNDSVAMFPLFDIISIKSKINEQ